MRTLSLLALLTLAAPLCAQGSDNKGKFYFKKTCKACHVEGKGRELTPLSKTQAQWTKFFATGRHGKDKLAKLATPEQLLDIQTFLVNHAKDSAAPETCGK